jgi:predicted GNAT family acetyltransferase
MWNALSTSHASFAEGNELAKRYPNDVTPLAATLDQSAKSYDSLAQLLGPSETTGLALVALPNFPTSLTVVRVVRIAQMVWNSPATPPVEHKSEDLNISNIHEMLALTELTNPGPFGRRTPELGSYIGIRDAGKLVAMAGERLRLPGYTEISAVCSHPEHQGRGYASSLVSTLVQQITKRHETPFLHVRTDNIVAIRVYEKLGFETRRVMNVAIAKRG